MDENTVEIDVDPTGRGRARATAGGPIEQTEGIARRWVLANIGAVAAACDWATGTYDRFVQRGERVQSEWQDRADELRQQNMGARGRVGDYVRGTMDTFLNTLNVPSKADIDTINVKLNIMSRKLDDMQMDRVRTSGGGPTERTPGVTPAPPPDLAT